MSEGLNLNFTYTVKEIKLDYILVEYQNGTQAEVPIHRGESKRDIEDRIADYYFPLDDDQRNITYDEIPFEVGEANTVSKDVWAVDRTNAARAQAEEDARQQAEATAAKYANPLNAGHRFYVSSRSVFNEDDPVLLGSQHDISAPGSAEGEPAPDDSARYDYKWLRLRAYPHAREVTWAQWRARAGDPAPLAAIDARYQEVDDLFPESIEPMTKAEFSAFLEKAAAL